MYHLKHADRVWNHNWKKFLLFFSHSHLSSVDRSSPHPQQPPTRGTSCNSFFRSFHINIASRIISFFYRSVKEQRAKGKQVTKRSSIQQCSSATPTRGQKFREEGWKELGEGRQKMLHNLIENIFSVTFFINFSRELNFLSAISMKKIQSFFTSSLFWCMYYTDLNFVLYRKGLKEVMILFCRFYLYFLFIHFWFWSFFHHNLYLFK